MTAPGYWMNETSGVLRPAVEAFLWGQTLTADQLAALRAYLRQWMEAPWQGADTAALRARINDLTSSHDIHEWLEDALVLGIDPL